MNLLRKLIDSVEDENASLESCLLKAKNLAMQLASQDLAKWLDLELDGYPEVVTLPSYRVIRVPLFGKFSLREDLIGKQQDFWQQLSPNALPPEFQCVQSIQFRENVACISDALTSGAPWHQRGWPYALAKAFRQTTEGRRPNHMVVSQVESRIPKSALASILSTVRKRLHDFLLELREVHPNLLDDEKAIQGVTDSDQIFKNVRNNYNFYQCAIGEGPAMSNQNVNAGRDINVEGDLIIAESIVNSLNSVEGSDASTTIKQAMRELGDAVAKLAKSLDEEKARDALQDFKMLAHEVGKPDPRIERIKMAGEGLSSVGKIAGATSAVVRLVKQVLGFFGIGSGA